MDIVVTDKSRDRSTEEVHEKQARVWGVRGEHGRLYHHHELEKTEVEAEGWNAWVGVEHGANATCIGLEALSSRQEPYSAFFALHRHVDPGFSSRTSHQMHFFIDASSLPRLESGDCANYR